jgi:hypothetical protein
LANSALIMADTSNCLLGVEPVDAGAPGREPAGLVPPVGVATGPAAGGAAAIDPVAQVEKLAQLLEKGLLTKEEFEKKKKELLGL